MDYSLNLGNFEVPLASGLRTEEVEKLISLIAQQNIPGQLIRTAAMQGELEVEYSHGVLSVSMSSPEKLNGRWRWDMKLMFCAYRSLE